MKSSLLKRLSQRYLLPHLAGVGIQRNLLYCEGIRCLLRGCVVESSSFDSNRFTVEAFVQPLYVPQESVVLTFGKRLGGGSGRRWSFDPSAETAIMADVLRAIQAEAVPLWQRFQTPKDLADHGLEFAGAPSSERVDEVIAYSRLASGNYELAYEDLTRLEARLRDLPSSTEWIDEMIRRIELLRSKLPSDLDGVKRLLQEWRDQTLRNIGLFHLSAK